MNTDALHPLTSAYLQELEDRARQLPPDQARELVEDIREHITSALGAGSSEAEVRSTLDRLGSPAEVVAAAGPTVPDVPAPPPASRAVEIGAIACLVVAELLFLLWPLGALCWLAGVVLLAVSKTWTGREKALGLAGLATGFPLTFLVLAISYTPGASNESCTGTGPVSATDGDVTCTIGPDAGSYGLVALAMAVAYLALQIYTVWRLTRPRRTA
jgi:uncharacterized membrane protein